MSYLVDNSYSVKNVSDLVTFVAPGSIVNGTIGLTWLDDGQYVEIAGEEFELTFHNFRKPFTYFKIIYKCETSGVLSFKDSLGNAYGETVAITGDPAWQTIDRDTFTGWDIQGADVIITFSGLTSNLFLDYVVFVANVSGTVGLNGTSGVDGAAGTNGITGADGNVVHDGSFSLPAPFGPEPIGNEMYWTYSGDAPSVDAGVATMEAFGGTQYYTPNINQTNIKVFNDVNYKLRFTLSTSVDNADLRVSFVDPSNGFARPGYSTDANSIVVGDAGNSGPGNADWYITGMTTAQVFEQNVIFTGLTVTTNVGLFFYYGGEYVGFVSVGDIHLDAIGLEGPAGEAGSSGTSGTSGGAEPNASFTTLNVGTNTLNAEPCMAVGLNNNVGRYTGAIGYGNTTGALGQVALGRDNSIGINCDKGSVTLGNGNSSNNEVNITIGGHLSTTNSRQVIVGFDNTEAVSGATDGWANNQLKSPVFIVGAGSGNTYKYNAIEVSHDTTDIRNTLILTDSVTAAKYKIQVISGTLTATLVS